MEIGGERPPMPMPMPIATAPPGPPGPEPLGGGGGIGSGWPAREGLEPLAVDGLRVPSGAPGRAYACRSGEARGAAIAAPAPAPTAAAAAAIGIPGASGTLLSWVNELDGCDAASEGGWDGVDSVRAWGGELELNPNPGPEPGPGMTSRLGGEVNGSWGALAGAVNGGELNAEMMSWPGLEALCGRTERAAKLSLSLPRPGYG